MARAGVDGVAPVFDLGSMSSAFPLRDVERILEETNRSSLRNRKLPAYVMTYYVIALGLMASVGTREVLRHLLDRFRERRSWRGEVASEAAITKARQRLGVEPLRKLYETFVRPIATRAIKSAWYRQWRVVSVDGTTLCTLDTPENNERFGRPPASRGRSAWPQVRLVALLENGTRVLFAAALDAYRVAETTLVRRIVGRLEDGMLCLADRGIYSYSLWTAAAATGAELLWRVQKGIGLPEGQRLADGSYLSEIRPQGRGRKRDSIVVRVVSFTITLKGRSERYRLITTILDPLRAPALELAHLYAARWTIETAFRELKVRQRDRSLVLRSQLPDLVEQDVYGLLLAHFGIRQIMCQAARQDGIEPAELSFAHALHVIIRRLPEMVAFSPSGEDALP
jgi:Insertion element 4 transposase N-terminal/Transposase DDE domain